MNINQYIEDRIEYWQNKLNRVQHNFMQELEYHSRIEELKLIQNQLKERE